MDIELRQQVVHHLLQVPDTSLLGLVVKNFVARLQTKTDEDLTRLVKEIKEQMADAPYLMQSVLGKDTYEFFKQLNLQ
jgi:hypothetical protein